MKIAFALLTISLASTALWHTQNRTLTAPPWEEPLAGLSYSPSGLLSSDDLEEGVTPGEIAHDLDRLASITRRVRTYTVDRGLEHVPALAAERQIRVSLGIWLGRDPAFNELEIARAIDVINRHPMTIDRVFVGNEVLLRGDMSAPQLADYIRRVQEATAHTHIPVGTADVWGVWLDAPTVAEVSDFLGVHLLPYWEGIAAEDATDFIASRTALLARTYPDKPIVLAEVGWPSNGRTRRAAVASAPMQAYFLRQFLPSPTARAYDYYVIEAFDQPWKAEEEGVVGAFWGFLDAQGGPKLQMTGALTALPQWPTYAAAAATALLVCGSVILWMLPAMRLRGYLLMAAILGMIVNATLFLGDTWLLPYGGLVSWPVTALLVVTIAFAALLILTETVEWATSTSRTRYRVRLPAAPPDAPRWPAVSIHVPTHNEPPHMVIRTLNALARLEYPNFEVIVFDNNTADATLWQPVAARCRALGPRFRFFHAEDVHGFKGGALNRALAVTSHDAEYIAVIDSDYEVAPDWLTVTVPAFSDPAVAVVQAPQDYRDAGDGLFKSMCYEEYATFFRVGMVERNEDNAIVQHGTMCVIRRSALVDVGGWAEWCITEDTELGLRLLCAGYRAVYTPRSLGRGLMPDTFDALRRQRYRWAYGAMQILRAHRGALLTRRSSLTWRQRYHFLAGWLPWVADAIALVFAAGALAWTALVIAAPHQFDVPLAGLSSVAIVLFMLKNIKTITLHRTKVGSGTAAAGAASLVGVALAGTVGRAVIGGLLTSSKPFLRTPKCETNAPWTQVLRIARGELVMVLLFVTAAALFGRATTADDPAELAWLGALAVFATPYASAVAVAMVSTLALPARYASNSLARGDAESAA